MGRPPRRLLDRDQIARAALDLLDREGPSGVGMRTIARHLGVQAPSLYNHVRSQDEIVDLVHELVDREIDVSLLDDARPGHWRAAFEAFAASYRAAFLRHPHAIGLVTRRPMVNRTALGVYEAASAALARVGLPAEQVMEVLAVLDFAVLGSTVDLFIDAFADADDAVHDDLPALRATLRATDRPRVDHDAFDLALRLLLDEVERRVDARPDALA